MPRPRKVHEGKSVLIECVIRVPGQENQQSVFEINNFKGRVLLADQSADTVESQIFSGLQSIYSERGVKVRHDIP